MTLSRVNHIWKLNQGLLAKFIGMIRWLRWVLSASCDKDSAIDSLYATEANWDVEILEKLLAGPSVIVDIVIRHNFLIKFEKMDAVYNSLLVLIRTSHFRTLNCGSNRSLNPLNGEFISGRPDIVIVKLLATLGTFPTVSRHRNRPCTSRRLEAVAHVAASSWRPRPRRLSNLLLLLHHDSV